MSLVKKLDTIVKEHGFSWKERAFMYSSALAGVTIPAIMIRYGVCGKVENNYVAWGISSLMTIVPSFYGAMMGFVAGHSFIYFNKSRKI